MRNSAGQTTNSTKNNVESPSERREANDRRKRPTPMFSRFLFIGRRRWNRRTEDPKKRYYVDRFGRKAWAAVAVILLLCGADAAFTAYHLSQGATEANPVVAWMMDDLGMLWPIAKYLITAAGLFFLLVHKNFTLARIATIFIVVMYGTLMIYHLSPFFI